MYNHYEKINEYVVLCRRSTGRAQSRCRVRKIAVVDVWSLSRGAFTGRFQISFVNTLPHAILQREIPA